MPGIAKAKVILNDLLKRRWSPRAFSPRPIDPGILLSLFEAARWSPSSMNEQPWRFIVAASTDMENHKKLFKCLSEGNQRWAGRAPVLILAVAKLGFEKYEGNNRHALYDLGQAMAHLTFQATAAGLFVHQMGGFSIKRARESFSVPQGFEPVAAAAIGYLDSPETLPDDLRERETAPRQRIPLKDLVFDKIWGHPGHFLPNDASSEEVENIALRSLIKQGRVANKDFKFNKLNQFTTTHMKGKC